MRRLRALLVAFAMLLCAGASAASKVLVVAGSDAQHLGQHIELFHDASGNAGFPAIVAAAANGEFVAPGTPVTGLGYHDGAWWVRFSLHNPADAALHRWLLLDWPFQHSADLYVTGAGGDTRRMTSGYRIPVEQRPLRSGQLLFPLTIPSSDSVTCYLKLSGKSISVANLSLWDPAIYADTEARRAALRFLLLGAVFVLVLFCALAANIHRRPGILLGGLADLLMVSVLFVLDGQAAAWFPANDELWMGRTVSFLALASVACYLGFVRAFLDLPSVAPRLARVCTALGWLTLALAVLFLLWLNQPLASKSISFAMLALLGVCVVAAGASLPNAKLLLLGWGINFLAILVRSISIDSSIAGAYFLPDIPFIGVAGAALVLSGALYRDIQRARHNADIAREALLAQRESEAVRLAHAIEERTRELYAAKHLADHLRHERSMLISMLGHELRSPLHAVLGYTRLLKRDVSERGELHRSIVERSAEQVLETLNEVIAISRDGTVELPIAPTPCELSALLREATAYGHLLARQNKVEFSVDVEGSLPPWVLADRRRVSQILNNLLGNAFKYTPTGRVTLSVTLLAPTQHERVSIRFAVADNGIGIDPAIRSRIFEPFFRAPGLELQPGIGLGLAISRRLLHAMGSDFELDSQPGSGSTFSFVLELPVLRDGRATAPLLQDVTGYRGLRRTVLVADADDAVRGELEAYARELGLQTLTAASGPEALAMCIQAASALDLVLIDQDLPGLDARSFLARIKRDPAFTDLPVVLLSSGPLQPQPDATSDLDFAGVLAKPVRLDEFVGLLGRLLRIEWTYAGGDKAPAAARGRLVRPAGDDLLPFGEFLARGEVLSIQRWAKQLAARIPEYGDFSAQVIALCRSVDLPGLHLLFEEAGAAAAED